MSNNSTGTPGAELTPIEPGLLREFAQMAMMIPSEDTGGMESILRQVLTAATWDDLDAPWESSKADAVAGKRLRFDRVERRPSDFRTGLGVFLVCHCTDIDTGEILVITTSATGVVAQLARAHALGAMPVIAEFVIAERPTKDGYHPHHLKVHASAAPVPADAAAPA